MRAGPPSPANMRGGIFVLALEREDTGGEREPARDVLVAQEPHQLAVVGEPGQRDSRHESPRERLRVSAVRSSRSRT